MSFFDRVKDSLSTAGAEMSQKVSLTADTMKLNNQIRSNEKELEKLIYQVGKQCVETHLSEENSEYEALFAQIRHCQEENLTLQSEIRRLNEECEEQSRQRQQMMKEKQELRNQQKMEATLDAMQQTILSEEDAPISSPVSTKLCTQCQHENELDSKFCIYCGTPFPENEG